MASTEGITWNRSTAQCIHFSQVLPTPLLLDGYSDEGAMQQVLGWETPAKTWVGLGDSGVKHSNPSPGPSWSIIEAKAGNPRPKIGPETPKWDR